MASQIQAMLASMYPQYSLAHGLGVDYSTGRYILNPHSSARRIIVDGTTSNPSALVFHVASYAAARAKLRTGMGDWILLKGGQTDTGLIGDIGNGSTAIFSGLNAQYPAVLGTFDPSDAENPAKWNTLQHTQDATGAGHDTTLLRNFNNPHADVAIVNQTFIGGKDDATCGLLFLGAAGSTGDRFLMERCILDGVYHYMQGKSTSVTGSMASQSVDDLVHDVTYNQCSFAYGNGWNGDRNGNCYAYMVKRLRFQRCINHHNGWGRGMTRSTPQWGDTSPAYDSAAGAGPDSFKHGSYISDYIDDVQFVDCINSWDASNAKLTGGNWHLKDLVEVRCPMGFIWAAYGNAAAAWPAGSILTCDNHLMIGSADITDLEVSERRGWGPYMIGCVTGSRYSGGILLNQDNPSSSNRRALTCTSDPGNNIATVLDMRNCILGGWGAQDQSAGTNVTKSFSHNIWDDSATGTNKNRTALGAQAAGITAAMARNVHTTFRQAYSELSGVTVDGDPLVTERNVMDYLVSHPEINWHKRFREHFAGPMGR